MIVKAATRKGQWQLWQADFELQFLGQNVGTVVDNQDPDFWGHPDIPTDDVDRLVFVDPEEFISTNEHVEMMVRWVKWYTSPETWMLVTTGPVYILNDEGRTIEALH